MAFLERNANSGSVATGYDIDNSVKLEADNSEYLTRDPSSAGDRQKFTTSMWVKRTELGQASTIFGVYPASGANNATVMQFGFMSTDKFQLGLQTYYVFNTTRLFRDTSAWYHIVVAFDTTQGTAANRIKLYVNGTQETAFDVEAYPSQNDSTGVNNTEPHRIGTLLSNSWYFSGYIAEVNHVDGSQLAPTEFGEFDEDSFIWKPKKYTGSYGTNGFYLDFADSGDLGDDESGNGNDFTETNIAAADQATDSPTNNFALLNILHPFTSTASHNPTFVEGATRFTTGRAGYWQMGISNIGLTSGKWYFEAQPGTSNSHITTIGYGDESDIHDWAQNIADTHGFAGETSTNSIGYLGSDTETTYGNVWLGTGSKSGANNSANYTISNIVGVAIDADNGYIYFAKDNTYINSGNPGSGSNGTGGDTFEDTTTTRTGTVFPAVGGYYHTAVTVVNVNFGGYTTISISSAASDANGHGTFEYAPPAGYYALCSKNLAKYGG